MNEKERLLKKYERRNLKEELSWAANYTKSGYMSKGNADYYSWLALAALQEIKRLENEADMA